MIHLGDCNTVLKTMPPASIQTCITSPPYWGLRDYGNEKQLGAEKTPEEFVLNLVNVFREVKRVLKDNGTLWLNLGDSYSNTRGSSHPGKTANCGNRKSDIGWRANTKPPPGLKNKDLVGIPWRVAFALQADGWYLRQDIIWHKPNPMPESVTDRCTKAHEYIFLLSKSPKYYFDNRAIKEGSVVHTRKAVKKPQGAISASPSGLGNNRDGFGKDITTIGRNKRSVWTVTTKPFKGAHFATFPLDLIEPCVLAGSAVGDSVLDPFAGAGTVGVACKKHLREFVGIELNPEYLDIANKRIDAAVNSQMSMRLT